MRIKLLLIISTILFISSVSAFQCFQLKEGQLGCKHASCMNCFTEDLKIVNINFCKNQPCIPFVDIKTELNIISPAEISTSRSTLLEITSNNPVFLYYGFRDTGRLTQLAKSVTKLSKKISLKEGQNNITIKAVDNNNKTIIKELSVFVDSKKPVIKSYTRTKLNGTFEIKFQEDNVKSVKLNIENKSNEILENCRLVKSDYLCSFFVDLHDYNNKTITYYFTLEDISGNKVTTSKMKAKINVKPTFEKTMMFEIQELKGGNDE